MKKFVSKTSFSAWFKSYVRQRRFTALNNDKDYDDILCDVTLGSHLKQQDIILIALKANSTMG